MHTENKFLDQLKAIINGTIECVNHEIADIDACKPEYLAIISRIEGYQTEADLKLAEIKANCREEADELEKLHEELKTLKTSPLHTEYETIKEDVECLSRRMKKEESLCKETKKQSELSPADKQTIYLAKKKYEYYKEITNIVWDYSTPLEESVSGCVRNASKTYIQPFEFDKKEITHSQLLEKVWKEIELANQDDLQKIERIIHESNKNIPNNEQNL